MNGQGDGQCHRVCWHFLSSESVFLLRDAGPDHGCTACSAESQWKSVEKGSIIQHQRENKIWVQVKECHKLNSSSASICPLLFGWAQKRKHKEKKKPTNPSTSSQVEKLHLNGASSKRLQK